MCPHVQRGLLSVLIIKLIMKIDFYSIFPLPTTKCFNRFLKVSSILLITSLPTIINRRCNIEIEIEIEIEIINQIRAPGGHIQTINKYDWYTTTIHQTKYSRRGINNCGAGTLGQEKRYAHKRTHTYSHIYNDEKWKKGIKSYLCLVQTGHVDIEEFPCGRKGERHTNM